METQVNPGQLAQIPLFAGVTSIDLSEIAALCVETHVRPGVRLVASGESGFSFSIILSGAADVNADHQTIATLGPGDVFGEMAIVAGTKRNADVIATSPMVLASMMVWDFREMVNNHTELKDRLDRLVAQRTTG